MYIHYTFTLVMGWIVASLRPIPTSPFNINYCSLIVRIRVTGILWPRSASIKISSMIRRGRVAGQTWPTSTTSVIGWVRVDGRLKPMSKTFTTSTITWVRVDGINIPISATLLAQRNFNNSLFRTFIVVVTAAGGRMAGITRMVS